MLEVKSNRDRFSVSLYNRSGIRKRESYYSNIIDKDPNKVAQILFDLYIQGIPIQKAIKIFLEKVSKKDWLGF